MRLSLVPKNALDPLLADLAAVGLRPSAVEIADGPDRGALLALRRRCGSNATCLAPPAVAGCGRLRVAGSGHHCHAFYTAKSSILASLDREIAAAKVAAAEADSLRQEIDRLSGSAGFIESERDKAGRPLVVLAAATRTLPDDSYLTEMELRQRKLTLSGRSAGAARLIGALAADPEFRNPGFSAPVTRLEALHAELFTINAEVKP